MSEKNKRAENEFNDNYDRVKFFPVFLAATMSVIIDTVQALVDETIVGQLFDDVAFSAFNLLEPYNMVQSFVIYLIIVGGMALIVRAWGADQKEEMRKIFNHSVTCCLLIGLLFFAVYSIFSEPLIDLVTQGGVAFNYSFELFYWQRFLMLVSPLDVFLFTYVLYMGGGLVATISMLIRTFANAGLSYYLGIKIGVGGVTLATVIATLIGMFILFLYVVVKKAGFRYQPYMDKEYLKKMFLLGLPESSLFIALFIVEAGVNYLALTHYSIHGVTVFAVLINVFEIVLYVSEGISEYETVAVNKAVGEKSMNNLRYGMRITFRAAIIEAAVFSLLFIFAAPSIVGIFEVDDAETAKLAISGVHIMAVSTFALITTRVIAIYLQYTERIGWSIIIWICTIGLSPLLFATLFSGISLIAMAWGFVLGPVLVTVLTCLGGKKIEKCELL